MDEDRYHRSLGPQSTTQMKLKKSRRRQQAVSRTASIPKDLPAAQSLPLLSERYMLLGQNVFPSLIVVITFLVFLPVLNNGFVDSDNATASRKPCLSRAWVDAAPMDVYRLSLPSVPTGSVVEFRY